MEDKELKVMESSVRAAMEACSGDAKRILEKIFGEQLTPLGETLKPGRLLRRKHNREIFILTTAGKAVSVSEGDYYSADRVVDPAWRLHRHLSGSLEVLPADLKLVLDDIPF